jgi:hypothetical protein
MYLKKPNANKPHTKYYKHSNRYINKKTKNNAIVYISSKAIGSKKEPVFAIIL